MPVQGHMQMSQQEGGEAVRAANQHFSRWSSVKFHMHTSIHALPRVKVRPKEVQCESKQVMKCGCVRRN